MELQEKSIFRDGAANTKSYFIQEASTVTFKMFYEIAPGDANGFLMLAGMVEKGKIVFFPLIGGGGCPNGNSVIWGRILGFQSLWGV